MPLLTSILLLVIFAVGLSYFFYDHKTGVITVATRPDMRSKMIALLKRDAEARKADGGTYVIVDLGSGSGQLSWHIARALPQARVFGIELSVFPFLFSVLRQKSVGPGNLVYRRENFESFSCGEASAVVLFLRDTLMSAIGEKLERELKPGTLVLSNSFPLPEPWQAQSVERIETPPMGRLYVYRKIENR